MMDITDDRGITAEHEAAHATVYLALGYPIHRIEIEPDALTQSSPIPVPRPVRDMAPIYAAGLIVEERYGVRTIDDTVAEAAQDFEDGLDLGELGDEGFFVRYPAMLHVAVATARDLLQRNAALHQAITAALLTGDGVMTGDDLAPTIRRFSLGVRP